MSILELLLITTSDGEAVAKISLSSPLRIKLSTEAK